MPIFCLEREFRGDLRAKGKLAHLPEGIVGRHGDLGRVGEEEIPALWHDRVELCRPQQCHEFVALRLKKVGKRRKVIIAFRSLESDRCRDLQRCGRAKVGCLRARSIVRTREAG